MILAGIVVLAVAVLGCIYFYVYKSPGPEIKPDERAVSGLPDRNPDDSSPQSSEADNEPAKLPKPVDQNAIQDEADLIESNPELPPLDESDALARNLFAELSNASEYTRWIGVNHLIQKITLMADNVSRGAVPAAKIRELAPKGKFSVLEKSPDRYLMDPRGYRRYDIYADTLASMDLSLGLRTFNTLRPLFDSAYQALGYPEGDFEQVLRKAIQHLLEAPVLSGEVVLVQPAVIYRFADPNLESLSAAQKQLIRTGPRNTRIVQSVLRGLLTQLDQAPAKPIQNKAPEE